MNGELDSFNDEPSLTSKAFISFASLLLFPISILNFVALPVGAIWLCVLGYWKLVVFSFLAAFIGGKIIGLITLSSFGLQAVAAKTIEGRTSLLRRFLSMLLLAGSYSYFSFVFGAWGLISFGGIIRSVSANATIPALLLAFAVGIWPEQAMADPTNRSIQENLCLLCGITEMVALSVLLLLHVGDPIWYLSACVIPIIIFVPVQVWIAWGALNALTFAEADDSAEAKGGTIRGSTNWSSKSRESAEPCFSIGQYSIDATIDELQDLTPLSPEEIVALNPGTMFDGEEIWRSPDAQFVGLQWNTILSTVNRAIYKISIQWTGPRHQAGTACREITICCTKEYGKQEDIVFQGAELTVWRASDGNISLQMVNMGPESLLNLTMTSRKVSQFKRI